MVVALCVEAFANPLPGASRTEQNGKKDPITVYRPPEKPKQEKPDTKRPPKRRSAPSPRASVEWYLAKRDATGATQQVDSSAPLALDDDVRLFVKPEQEGYLYVIHQEPGQQPYKLYPDSRVSNGQALVPAGVEQPIPAFCPQERTEQSCWRRITRRAGSGMLVVVFSRKQDPSVVDRLLQHGPLQVNASSGSAQLVDAASKLVTRLDERDEKSQPASAGAAFTTQTSDSGSRDGVVVDAIPFTVQEPQKRLALQWHMIKRGKDRVVAGVASPTLLTTDEVRLLFRPEQDGYLYVLKQVDGQKPVVVFPDVRINNGANFVAANQESYVPLYCSENENSPDNCWRQLTSQAGTVSLVVVFTTEPSASLAEQIKQFGPVRVVGGATPGAPTQLLDVAGKAIATLDGQSAAVVPVASTPTNVTKITATTASAKQLVGVIPLKVEEPPRQFGFQWRVVRRETGGVLTDVDLSASEGIYANDEIRFVVRPEKDGYLYVFYQEEGKVPVQLFPDSRVNNGSAFVPEMKDFYVPNICDDNPRSADYCWTRVTKRGGRGILVIAFSREANPALAAQILAHQFRFDFAFNRQLVDASGNRIPVSSLQMPVQTESRKGFLVTPDINGGDSILETKLMVVDGRRRPPRRN